MVLAESKLMVTTLRFAGPVFFMGMQASSVRTAMSILENKSTLSLSPLPFISLLTNCVIWTYYGYLRADNTVLIPNFAGVLSGAFCATSFHRFAHKAPWNMYIGSFGILAFASACALAGNYKLLGSIGCILAIILMGSPLATLKTVLTEKSTASLPFLTSFTGWCNALAWSSYGLLVAHDAMIYGPNLVGLTLASFQLFLFVLFGFPKASTLPASKTIF